MSEGGKISLRCFHFDIIIVIACLLLLLCCKIAISDINTLHQSDTLNSTSRLVSSNNKFILGFFNITTTTTNTNKTYLGIWYEVDPSNPVWIANRDTPITNGSASLIFDSTGLLLINRTLGDPVQLCSPETNATAAANTTAVLFDNGNLVVRVTNSDGSVGRSLWESFDCPTDTLLPEMKLGVNHRTKRNWTLTSWLAEDDPSSGPFTLDWDPSALQLVVRRRGVDFWTSGVLQQNDTFPNLYDFLTGYYNMTYTTSTTTSQSSEEFFNYSLSNNSMYQEDRTNIKWRIYYMGSLFFDEERSMELYAACYGEYNTNNGCAKWAQPACRSYSTNFTELSGYFTEESSYYNQSMGPDDCRVRCWNDCDCQAYRKNDYLGCSTYSKSLLFRQDPSGNSPKFYVIQRPQNRAGSKNIVWIALSVSITLLFVFIIFIIFCLRRKRKGKVMRRRKEELLQLMTQSDTSHKANGLESDYNFAQNLKIFSFESIVEATNNFSPENKLGQGGFGPVYKGNLAEGTEIAVKRLSKNSGQGLVEFKNELILIAKLQHMNLVRLLGCSIQAEEMMLVYEYMPNKSLDFFLFDSSKRGMLDWRKRVDIIEGIAQGLLYLHQHSRLRIIHRDLKAGNILLDAEMNPKISDFGMARIFKQNDLIVNTNRIVGTYGYMSPEYAMEGIFSVKSDVFSFGVLTLEILSGRRNNSFYNTNRPLNLVGYAWDLWQRGDGLELMDPSLCDSCSAGQFLRFLQVGLLCVEDSPSDRPTISEVISMTTNENTHLPRVKKPAFMNLDRITKEDSQKNNALEDYSVNGMSISTMNAR